MKFLTAIVSLWIVFAIPHSARADGPTFSNGIIGKIFNWKADHAEKVLRLDAFPDCGDRKVLNRIVKRYNWAEKHTWQRGVELDDINRARERRTLAGGDRQINRRYCRGHAHLSNGAHRTVYYLIEQRQGFASIGWNVEFCIAGHDRWMAYDGSCRVLRR